VTRAWIPPTTDLPLFSAELGAEARDEAVDRVRRHASEDWKLLAHRAAVAVCERMTWFTTDDVLEAMPAGAVPHEPRAWGAVMSALSGTWCEPTDRYELSRLVRCHRRPKRVWRSLVHQGDER
jgi:hypothetical protein